jgi:hypothetical protein
MRVLDLDGRKVHSGVKGDTQSSVCVARGTMRGFLSPKAHWMAASRKKRSLAYALSRHS